MCAGGGGTINSHTKACFSNKKYNNIALIYNTSDTNWVLRIFEEIAIY